MSPSKQTRPLLGEQQCLRSLQLCEAKLQEKGSQNFCAMRHGNAGKLSGDLTVPPLWKEHGGSEGRVGMSVVVCCPKHPEVYCCVLLKAWWRLCALQQRPEFVLKR